MTAESQPDNGTLEQLQRKLQESEEQLKVYIDRLQHLQADFENYKKRVSREQAEYAHYVENGVLLKVLPLFDGFERAFRAYSHNRDEKSFIEGIERIFSQFSEFLKSQEIQPIEALGQPFDPSSHEALLMIETDEKPNVVLEEFERGYRRRQRLLRPSRVKVSRKREAPVATSQTQAESKKRKEEGGST